MFRGLLAAQQRASSENKDSITQHARNATHAASTGMSSFFLLDLLRTRACVGNKADSRARNRHVTLFPHVPSSVVGMGKEEVGTYQMSLCRQYLQSFVVSDGQRGEGTITRNVTIAPQTSTPRELEK